MRDLHGADVAMPASQLDPTDPRGRLCGAMAKWAEWICPTSIVGTMIDRDKRGGVLGPLGDAKAYNAFLLHRR